MKIEDFSPNKFNYFPIITNVFFNQSATILRTSVSVLFVWSNPGVSTKTISPAICSGKESLTALISLVHDSKPCPTATLEFFATVLMNLIDDEY